MITIILYLSENKHIGINDPLPMAAAAVPEPAAEPTAAQSANLKALSPDCQVIGATDHSQYHHRKGVS